MMENKINQNGKRPVYEPVEMQVVEIAPRGVLCVSSVPAGVLTSGLKSYSGSAL